MHVHEANISVHSCLDPLRLVQHFASFTHNLHVLSKLNRAVTTKVYTFSVQILGNC